MAEFENPYYSDHSGQEIDESVTQSKDIQQFVSSAVNAEKTRAEGKEAEIEKSVSDEKQRAEGKEAEIDESISQLAQNVTYHDDADVVDVNVDATFTDERIGNLKQLTTTAKGTVVDAVNEINEKIVNANTIKVTSRAQLDACLTEVTFRGIVNFYSTFVSGIISDSGLNAAYIFGIVCRMANAYETQVVYTIEGHAISRMITNGTPSAWKRLDNDNS